MSPSHPREAAFSAALAAPGKPAPDCLVAPGGGPAGRRFDVYRNNVVAGLVAALGEAFPVTRRLLGETFFDAAARDFARKDLPRSPLLFRYGTGFPAFLEALPALGPYPYVPDVARLERARLDARDAADAVALGPAALAAVPPDALAGLALPAHPAARLVPSRFALLAIHGAGAPVAGDPQWALVTRPAGAVSATALSPAAGAFARSLLSGAPLGEAAAAGGADLDLAGALATLLAAGAFRAGPLLPDPPASERDPTHPE